MRLKYQLLLLGLLSLLLPITGWFALKSVDIEFRYSIEQASRNTLTSLQASVEQILKSNTGFLLRGLVLNQLPEIILDGDDSEWSEVEAYVYTNDTQKITIKIGEVKHKLSLFIHSNDSSISYSSSGTNDHVIIGLADDRGLFKYKLARQAEGKVIVKQNSIDKPSYQAYWHELANGYNVEIQFEINDFHHLGLASVNLLDTGKFVTGTLQQDEAQTLKLIPIIANNYYFQQAIEKITPENSHFQIIDNNNRTIYQSNKLPDKVEVSAWQWLITPVYQWLFNIEDSNHNPSSNWFYREKDGMAGIYQTTNKNGINYSLKSMLPQGQQSMIQTLLKAAILMVAVVFITMLSYLLYSLILAWRIKNLNKAMQSVLDDSGKLHIQMPSHKAKDEIGQLSRGIQTMLAEMREYTQYLKEFGSRLSHEMKTPLAIVQTSLDNMEFEQNGELSEFLKRAQLGTNRLKFILNQLSELSRLKYTLENTPKERFNLTELCWQLGKSYQSFIPQLKLDISSENIHQEGSNELMAQLLDKLMDNAKDFTPDDGVIELKLKTNKENIYLSVTNTGSQVPEHLNNSIFDSLITLRSKGSENHTHLGLGLYIVKLISRFHHGEVTAVNDKINNSVEFTLKLYKS